jgi:hypothetical protein
VKHLKALLNNIRTVLEEAVQDAQLLTTGEGEERDLIVQVRSALERSNFMGINRKVGTMCLCMYTRPCVLVGVTYVLWDVTRRN